MREARGPAWTHWLVANGVPALSRVDTRSLVLHLRERGAMRGAILTGAGAGDVGAALRAARGQPSMSGSALAGRVSTKHPYTANESGSVRIAVVDCGVKRSIVRRLVEADAFVTILPHDADADTLARFDGVLLSNGPGDPEPLVDEVSTVRALLGRVPVLGICLGHQLLALATGLSTFKLPFGHRGANHPVLERASGRVLVTSQNHGFAVAPSTERAATHESLYDGTVEGLSYPELRARSVQFHPEASPGPHDARPLLAGWVEEVRRAAA
jgi:carbamoyl-phosphate synthase small subunit